MISMRMYWFCIITRIGKKKIYYVELHRIMNNDNVLLDHVEILVNVFVLPWLHFANFQEFPVDTMPAVEAVDAMWNVGISPSLYT